MRDPLADFATWEGQEPATTPDTYQTDPHWIWDITHQTRITILGNTKHRWIAQRRHNTTSPDITYTPGVITAKNRQQLITAINNHHTKQQKKANRRWHPKPNPPPPPDPGDPTQRRIQP